MPAYVPTDWIDLTTLVDATRLDNMESGIVAAERSENKGAANGYAPLDATAKVPAANLPAAGGGGGADYEGAWAVGTPYVQGDVVLYNGVEYLAVNPSTGQTPPAPAAPPAVLAIPLVTSLPVSPFDGQEVILTDSLTAGTYFWRLRYTAGITDAYKWVFIGGALGFSEVPTAEAPGSSGAYVALATAGPLFALPRPGIYDVAIGAYQSPTNNATLPHMSYDIGATGAVDADALRPDVAGTGSISGPQGSKERRKTFVSAVTLTAKYKQAAAATTFKDRWMRITPVRIG